MNTAIIFINILILILGVPVAMKVLFKHRFKKYIIPVIAGILLCLVSDRLLVSYANRYIGAVLPGLVKNKWFYGFVIGFIPGIFDEVIRYQILLYCHRHGGKWIKGVRRTAAFGMAQGWLLGIFTWGVYMFQLAEAVLEGEIERYGLTAPDLLWGLSEAVMTTVLMVGLTYLIKYGFYIHKRIKYLIFAILYHGFAVSLLYYIPYLLNLPQVVAEIIYAAMSIGLCVVEFRLVRREKIAHH